MLRILDDGRRLVPVDPALGPLESGGPPQHLMSSPMPTTLSGPRRCREPLLRLLRDFRRGRAAAKRPSCAASTSRVRLAAVRPHSVSPMSHLAARERDVNHIWHCGCEALSESRKVRVEVQGVGQPSITRTRGAGLAVSLGRCCREDASILTGIILRMRRGRPPRSRAR